MSIVKLARITVYGHAGDKEGVLTDLQDIGCLHLIPLRVEEELLRKAGPRTEAREALKFLLTCPQRRPQAADPWTFDAHEVEREALELKRRIEELADERDFLRVRIRDLKPFGNFVLPPLEDLKNLRLWFYAVPHRLMAAVEQSSFVWEVVNKDARFSYVAVVSEKEPEGMPVVRTRTGSRSLGDLEHRLGTVERELDDLQVKRASLTRWCTFFVRAIFRLEDQAELARAAGRTYDESEVFALQAWAPLKEMPRLEEYVREKGLALEVQRPTHDDNPPTLLANKKPVASGQDLVSFYTTPSYWLWDPSAIVFFSFAVFFAMIVSDAAYGLVLGSILGLLWRRMGRSPLGRRLRFLGLMMVVATVIYGVMVGSYFGVSPPADSLLHRLKIVDLNNFRSMMKISIIVGVIHLIVANALDFWRWRWSMGMLGPLGWMFMWVGAVILWRGIAGDPHRIVLDYGGVTILAIGMMLVLFFTRITGPLWKRLVFGLKGLTRLSGAFGDTLSYLRLFALGLASASLAMTFNGLAKQVGAAVPGIGFLLSLLIIVLGHGLNLVLAFASGVIHGLRLNFIEFFNWGMPEEGYPFRAFARKEKALWTT